MAVSSKSCGSIKLPVWHKLYVTLKVWCCSLSLKSPEAFPALTWNLTNFISFREFCWLLEKRVKVFGFKDVIFFNNNFPLTTFCAQHFFCENIPTLYFSLRSIPHVHVGRRNEFSRHRLHKVIQPLSWDLRNLLVTCIQPLLLYYRWTLTPDTLIRLCYICTHQSIVARSYR